MTKKINKPEIANSESEVSQPKIEQVKDQTSWPTATILQTDKNSLLEKKFSELTFDKKRKYLHTVFWTVRWTTWFFDMWFTASMSDYKTFDIWNNDMADVIIKNSGMYSDAWWWSESDNSIVIIFQWKIYSWWWARYFETKKIDRPYLDYKEIIDCKFDESKDEFTITVKCADNSTKTISAKDWSKYNFEEELISKFRVPKELLQKEEEIKKLLQEEISKEEKELATQNMYQRALDLFILKNNREQAEKYINKPWLKLSEDQKKSYVEYLLNGRKQHHGEWMRREDMQKLLVFLQTFDDKDYIKDICDKMLEKSVRWSSKDEIFESIKETIELWWFDIQDWYTKKIDYYCKYERYFKEIWESILESKQDAKLRYKKYYDLHKPTDQLKLDIIATSIWENVEDLFKESFLNYIEKAEIFGCSRIEYFLKVMKEKWYEESLYWKVFDKILPGNYDSLRKYADSKQKLIDNIIEIRSHTDKKINDNLLFEMFCNTSQDNREDLWNKISPKLSTEEIKSTLDMMIDKYLNENKQFCDLNLIIKRWFKDTTKILRIFDKILWENLSGFNWESWIKYCNILISTLKNKELLSKNNLLEDIHKLYRGEIDKFFKKWSIWYFIELYSVHFKRDDDKDFLEDTCKRLSTESWDKFSGSNLIVNGFKSAGFSRNRIKNFISNYSQDIWMFCTIIEWGGLNIDKVRVNDLIEDLFQQWKVLESEKLSRAWWLYDLRKKKIISWKLENQKLDYRDAWRAIEEWWLDKSYYKYVIDLRITRWDIADALWLAEKYDLLISDEQFDRYLWRDERLREADEERKLREKKEREKKAVEMMKFVSEWKISCNINYEKDQKYILIWNREKWLIFASHNLERHKNIVSHIWEDPKHVVWWGRITIDEQQKILKIYWSSGDFWKVAEEYNEILINIVSPQYPEYKIIIE